MRSALKDDGETDTEAIILEKWFKAFFIAGAIWFALTPFIFTYVFCLVVNFRGIWLFDTPFKISVVVFIYVNGARYYTLWRLGGPKTLWSFLIAKYRERLKTHPLRIKKPNTQVSTTKVVGPDVSTNKGLEPAVSTTSLAEALADAVNPLVAGGLFWLLWRRFKSGEAGQNGQVGSKLDVT